MSQWTHTINGQRVAVSVGVDHEGKVRSVSVELLDAPVGSPFPTFLSTVCRAITTGLRKAPKGAEGPLLAEIVDAFTGQQFGPAGVTDDPLVPRCSSLADYLARSLVARGYVGGVA